MRIETLSLVLFLIIFLALGTYYALGNPLFCKPDEAYHYAYALHLKSGYGLPYIDTARIGLGSHTPVEMEGHQPPLYYGLVAALGFIFQIEDKISPSVNPHFLGTQEGNRNPVTPAYTDFSSAPLFFITGRFLSLLYGSLLIISAYALARLFVPWPVALLTVLFVGLNPQFVFISSSFSNDMAGAALVHLGLWQLGRAMREGITLQRGAQMGLTIALATLAKLTGLGLFIPLGILALWQSWRTLNIRPLLWAGVAGLILLVVDGWWFWRNWNLYGDPFATNLLPVLLGPRTTPFTWEDIRFLMSFLWKAYWLDFSPGGILFAEPPVYAALGFLCLVGSIGLILALVRQKDLRPFFILLWGWFLIVLVGLMHLTSQTAIFMGGGRLLFPAAITIGASLATGLTEIFRRPIVPGILAALLGIYAAIAPAHYLHPTYPRPTLTKHIKTPPMYELGAYFGDRQFELVGYDLEQTGLPERPALSITFYWHTLKETDRNFSVFIHLETQEKGHPAILTQLDTYPGYGVYPNSVWRAGWIFVDRPSLPLPPPGQPFSGDVLAGLYFLPNMERLPAYDRTGWRFPADAVPLARIRADESGVLHVVPMRNLESPPAYPLNVYFGNRQFELIGYDLEQTELSGRRAVRITYYWRALEKTDRNFSVFIHLETLEGGQVAILTQTDTYPGYGIWPTSAWQPGWIFVDRLALPLPPPGQAFSGTVLTGLYFLPTMERLPAYDQAGQRFPADAVPLACIWADEEGDLRIAAPIGPGVSAIADSPCDGSIHR